MSLPISENISLDKYTSWLIGGFADFFCLPRTVEELREAQQWAQERSLPLTFLGGGSNVLVSDRGIRGLTICLKNFSGAQVRTDSNCLRIEALSGTSKSELLKIFLKYKLPPALFLAGIPGDVGGGIVMNAGVAESFTPREFVELVDWVEILRPDGSLIRKNKNELNWSYRHCDGWQPGVITQVGLSWPIEIDEKIIEKVREANKVRLSKQPLDWPSCGSVFVNPTGYKAAQLIDQCGLKGQRIGDAQVSLKHANFIVNLGKATALDTWELILFVQNEVLQKKGVQLKTEVVRLGDWS
jgi:UDP-N-acetylmuramate dehydrogenase